MGGEGMPRKLFPPVAALRRRRRTIVVASLPVVIASIVFALAGGSGTDTAGKDATQAFGIARASSAAAGTALAASASTTSTSFGPNVSNGIFQGESPEVASLPVLPVTPGVLHARDIESLKPQQSAPGAKDPVVQGKKGTGPISGPIQNFDGICLPFGEPCALPSSCSCLPPDTNGEVGATQYVQMVNTDFVVFSKTGAGTARTRRRSTSSGQTPAASARSTTTAIRWSSTTSSRTAGCFRSSSRRPATDEEYGQCFAVSTTSRRHGLVLPLRVPLRKRRSTTTRSSASGPTRYYMSSNEFPDGQQTSSGAGAFAFERAKMLAGQPARVVYFDEAASNPPGGQYIGQLPGDLDGTTLPPTGAPNLFAEIDDASTIPPTTPGDLGFKLRLWKFHVDWANPANSTFGNHGTPDYALDVAPYVRPQCVYGYGPNCVPQKGGPQALDVLGDRLMFRLAYRNFGSYASLLLNHTVVTPDARDGVRWYEVRIPKGGQPSVYQQGTYAPTDAATARSGAGWGASRRTRRATSPSASALRGRTTTRQSGTPAATPATRSGR